jgi:hypothetical protein
MDIKVCQGCIALIAMILGIIAIIDGMFISQSNNSIANVLSTNCTSVDNQVTINIPPPNLYTGLSTVVKEVSGFSNGTCYLERRMAANRFA